MAFNLFDTPDYYTGLLGEEATQKLQNKALGTGLVNAALAFIAQPRNQRYGSALPYLGKALLGGYQAGQDVISGGLKDWETKRKIEQLKAQDAFRAKIGQPNAERKIFSQETAQVPVTPVEGAVAPNFATQAQAPTVTTERYFDPNVMMKEALASGALDLKDYLTFAAKQKEESLFDKPNIKDFTSASIAKYQVTGNPQDLDPIVKATKGPTAAQEYEWAGNDPKKLAFLRDRWTANAAYTAAAQAPYKETEQAQTEAETRYKYGTPEPVNQSFQVTAGGKTYYFKDQKSANAFKKKAGL